MQLVFVHGAGGNGAVWRQQSVAFEGADAITLPGHPSGKSYNSIEDYVTWLRGYISGRGYTRPVVVGHSMGGGIALTYALKYPEELSGIGLVASGARLRVLPKVFEMIRQDYSRYAEWASSLSLAPDAPADLRAGLVERVLSVDPDLIYGDFQACDRFDIMADLDRVAVPAFIVVGAADQMTPPKYAQYLADHLAGSEMTVVPGAGHYVQIERPAETNAAIEHFLSKLPR